MNKDENLHQKKYLDQLGLSISRDEFDKSIEKLKRLCLFYPFKTQIYVQLFINAWCAKILSMLEKKSFDIVGSRIRSLYMLITFNRSFDKLIKIYFEKIKKEKNFKKLKNFDEAIYFSLESQYFFQKAQYIDAELSARKCLEKIEYFFKKKYQVNESWLLVRKCLKNIKDKNKANEILKKILKINEN